MTFVILTRVDGTQVAVNFYHVRQVTPYHDQTEIVYGDGTYILVKESFDEIGRKV